jgi:hypothetical protein
MNVQFEYLNENKRHQKLTNSLNFSNLVLNDYNIHQRENFTTCALRSKKILQRGRKLKIFRADEYYNQLEQDSKSLDYL